ncbi:MAG: hypothetical protein HRF43_13365 [Phycisphaerae bacterium]|jgi:hypothetical protein
MRRNVVSVVIATLAAGLVGAPACRQAPPVPVAEVVAVAHAAVPLDPLDAAWQRAPEHVAVLLLQDLVEPRQTLASTPEVRVRALTDGARIGFRLEWADAVANDLPGAARFSDACAVQLPSKIEPNVPAPQMGEPGRPVEITYWSAAWQANVNGRGDSINDLYPNAAIDHYPFQAASLSPDSSAQREMALRYAPARAVGNPVAGPHASAVQDLVAEGPGTLAPAPPAGSQGLGKRTPAGWAVVIVRRMPDGLTGPTRSQVAFAVWEGSKQEAGAVKMRTGWIPLAVRGQP